LDVAHRARVGAPTLTQDTICSGTPCRAGREEFALYGVPGLSNTHLRGSWASQNRFRTAKTQTCRVADAQRRVAWSLNAGSAHPPSIGEFTLVVDGPTAQTLSANWLLGLAYAMRHEGVLRRISVGGLPYTSAKTELNRRKLLKPACIAIWVIDRPVSSMRRLARCTRAVLATFEGLAWR